MTDDVDTLARTIWGEDRGGGSDGMTAVAWVIINRVNNPGWWGHDIQSVCHAHMQFDCWNPNDPNYEKLATVDMSDPTFAVAVQIAQEVIDGNIPDPTNGATSYYAKSMHHPPQWSVGKTPLADIGNQLYFAV